MQLTKDHVAAVLAAIDMVPAGTLKDLLRDVAVTTHGAVLLAEQVAFEVQLYPAAAADATAYTEDELEVTPESVLPNTQNITSQALNNLQLLISIGGTNANNDEEDPNFIAPDELEEALMAWEEVQDILEERIYKGI